MKYWRIQVLLLILLVILYGVVSAQVPNSMNYQGRLTNSTGEPVADGDYSIFFRIYTAGVGGGIIWSSDRMSVSVADGLFSVRLGPFYDILFSADSSRWLGIQVDGDEEISPRTQLRTVPYAFYAKSAAPSAPIMWSGGCSTHGVGVEVTYCTDIEDFNTADGYLTVTAGGMFTVETAGFYRINAWAANLSDLSGHVTILKNGSPILQTTQNTQSDWHTMTADVTWYFGPGDTFRVDYYSNSGEYAYHSYNGNCCYSRLQVTYVGPQF